MTDQYVTSANPLMVAEDLSAIGTMSLGVAVPILAACNVPVASVPTQLLSTQTEGFDNPAKQSSAKWLEAVFAHWTLVNVHPSAGLIGYLGQSALITQLKRYLAEQSLSWLILDPVMADNGTMYPGLPTDYVEQVRSLITEATIITPNWTELQLLIGQSPQPEADRKRVRQAVDQLWLHDPDLKVVVTGISVGDQVRTMWFENDSDHVLDTRKRPGHFYGSGDVFTAVLSGGLANGISFNQAVKLAVRGTAVALDQTAREVPDHRFGMRLSQLLKYLVNTLTTH